MTTEQLANEYGKMAARAFNFLYENLASEPEITDVIKQRVKAEREAVFATIIPIIEKFRSMGEDDKETFNLDMALAMMENADDIDTRSEELESALGTITATPDQNFVMDVLSLYLVMSFLDDNAFDDEDAPPLPAHVGLK